MKKFTFIPTLLVALSAPIFTASVFATPVNQQSAWDIKQPLSQSFAQTVSIGARYEDELQRGLGLTGNFDFDRPDNNFSLVRHENERAQINSGEFQRLLSVVQSSYASRANDLTVDASINSLTADTGTGVIAALAVPATSVSEPGSLALLIAGMTGIMVMRRRAK